MKTPPDPAGAPPPQPGDKTTGAESDSELLAALEQVIPHTWRQMSDFDSVLHDIGMFVRDRDAAARAQGVREGAEKMRALDEAVIEAARKVLAQYEPHEIVDAEAELRDALAARDAALKEEAAGATSSSAAPR